MLKIQIGGSPCTFWSIARAATNSPITRETLNEGMGWELYLNYLIALEKFRPDIWLYENVASMSKEIKASISAHFDRDPYQINGSLVSAAERDRFWWTNIEGVEPPAERGIVLQDILETDVSERYFYDYPLERIDMSKQVCAYMVCKNYEMHKRVFNPAFSSGARSTDGEKVHPTQKPVALLTRMIEDSTEPGAVVLDTFMGSGTTAVACLKSGRQFIGFELDGQYHAIAQQRIAETVDELMNE